MGGDRNGVVSLTILTLTLELSACSQAKKEANLCKGKNHVDFPKQNSVATSSSVQK